MKNRLNYLALLLAISGPAAAQQVSEDVKRTCKSFTQSQASSIVAAVKAKRDPASAVRRVADSWLEGVQNHMLLAASKAEYLSEQELGSLGYSYCVERRPSGR